VDVAGDGQEALVKATLASYDVVVLDRDLPKCTATSTGAQRPEGADAQARRSAGAP
jgi:DNA-binding response OmpR family regulator